MTPCKLWSGSVLPSGYGQGWCRRRKRSTQAHRMAYEAVHGPIPEGLQIDHLCRVRACVNPDHLRVVTCRDNILAPGATTLAKANAEKTKCNRGHVFSEENTYRNKGKRHCRVCRAEWKARKRVSVREANPAHSAAYVPGAFRDVTPGSIADAFLRLGWPVDRSYRTYA